MSYESKFYIVEKQQQWGTLDAQWTKVIAMFDVGAVMQKFPILENYKNRSINTNCYFYSDNGEDEIIDDMYGEPLKEFSLEGFVTFLETNPYIIEDRRMCALFTMLRFMERCPSEFKDVVVLHFGH